MGLEKILISPQGGSAFEALFNPTQYGVDKSNQIAETAIPGLEAPLLQYVHGNTRSLSMDLFFDTYEEQSDVRGHTEAVYKLLLIDPDTHVPPICDIAWGTLTFTGVLDHVSGKFTLFFPDGRPARATLSVVFKEYIKIEVLVRENPTRSADHRKTRLVKAGDRLFDIAYEEYGDAAKWRPIADANRLSDPLRLEPGHRLVIPALDPAGRPKYV
jgi:nucleoid-associated protein YgaU